MPYGLTRHLAADAGGGDHRIAHRHKIFEPTTVCSEDGDARAHLINISATGALVHMIDPPKRGSAVSIILGDASAEAHVVWANGSRLGLAFRTRLTSAIIDPLLRG